MVYNPDNVEISVGGERSRVNGPVTVSYDSGSPDGSRTVFEEIVFTQSHETTQKYNQHQQRVKNWANEFYDAPILCAETTAEALKQGIKKWTGCLPENLDLFGITISDVETFTNGDGCALCLLYEEMSTGADGCPKCPLDIAGENCNNGYSLWKMARDEIIQPLINKLKQLLTKEEA